MRTVMKYTLLQLPSLALVALALVLARRWIDIPTWAVIAVVVLWAAKDAALYPLQRDAFDSAGNERSGLVGRRGVVKDRLNPAGTVWLEGALWRAEAVDGKGPVEAGMIVEVRALTGLTLHVEPLKTVKEV